MLFLELKEAERQIILYSKLHYEWHVLIQDMSVIVGKDYGIDCMEISTDAVYRYVVDLYDKLHSYGFLRQNMSDFVKGLFESHKQTVNYEGVMRKMIIVIQGIELQLDTGLTIEIGKPNAKLLPSRKK